MAKAQKKVPVSERALVARINRALAKQEETLRRCREDSRSFPNLGGYYVLDIRRNAVTDTHVNIETYGQQLGVLQAWEKLD